MSEVTQKVYGLKLSSLTAFLLLFSFVPSLPPRVLQLIFPKGHFGPAQCPGPCPRTPGLEAIILPLAPERPPVAPATPPHISCPCHQLYNPFEHPVALIASHINSIRMSGGGVQSSEFFFFFFINPWVIPLQQSLETTVLALINITSPSCPWVPRLQITR